MPVTIFDSTNPVATQLEMQRKGFRNPRPITCESEYTSYTSWFSIYLGRQEGQIFYTPPTQKALSSVQFYLSRVGGLTGYCYARLYAIDGSGRPTGSPIAESQGRLCSGLQTEMTWETFTFSPSVTLQPNTWYAITLYYGEGSATVSIRVGYDLTSIAHVGWRVNYDTSSWNRQESYKILFILSESWSFQANLRYVFFVESNNVCVFMSGDGVTWISAFREDGAIVLGVDVSVWYYNDVSNSRIIIHVTYKDEVNNYIMYRQTRVDDANSYVVLGTEVTVDDADDGNWKPMIFLGRQGYLHIIYEKDDKSKGKNYYRVWIISTNVTYPINDNPWVNAVKSEAYLPSLPDYRVFPSGVPTVAGASPTYECVVAWIDTYDNYIRYRYVQFNGSTHTFDIILFIAGTIPKFSMVSNASGNDGAIFFAYISAYNIYITRRVIGGAITTVVVYTGNATYYATSVSVGIDKTSSPVKLYVFYTVAGKDGDVFYKTANVDFSVSGDWSSEVTIDDDSEACNYLSASYRDWNNDKLIQLIYTTQTTHLVRFVEVGIVPIPWKALRYENEPPIDGWNKVLYVTELPSTGWNKLRYTDE